MIIHEIWLLRILPQNLHPWRYLEIKLEISGDIIWWLEISGDATGTTMNHPPVDRRWVQTLAMAGLAKVHRDDGGETELKPQGLAQTELW